MTVYATENIRNVALVGHSDTGKTSMVSAMLFDSGAVNRLTKVDDGNTTTDFDEDEHDRKITINTAVAHVQHRGVKVNLIDTPGYGIFSTDALQGLRVADSALMMIPAVAGIEVQTEKMWKSAARSGRRWGTTWCSCWIRLGCTRWRSPFGWAASWKSSTITGWNTP